MPDRERTDSERLDKIAELRLTVEPVGRFGWVTSPRVGGGCIGTSLRAVIDAVIDDAMKAEADE